MAEDDIDMTDDWMNPVPHAYTCIHDIPKPGDPIEYRIERERRVICFGNPGSYTQWDFWASFDSAEKRDAELARLRKHHPIWHLRARDRDPYREYITGMAWGGDYG